MILDTAGRDAGAELMACEKYTPSLIILSKFGVVDVPQREEEVGPGDGR